MICQKSFQRQVEVCWKRGFIHLHPSENKRYARTNAHRRNPTEMPRGGNWIECLASAGFSRNERLARFLRFVVEQHLEGKDGEIKESVIAIEVFGRGPDHDPEAGFHREDRGRQAARAAE